MKKIGIIGAGPGGYSAAFYAADKGLDVTLIDADSSLGGVCLNRGCIPSKALLHLAKVISESSKAAEWGIEFNQPTINLEKIHLWRDRVVRQMSGGLVSLARKRKIKLIQGYARFVDSQKIEVQGQAGGSETLTFDYIVIATGSQPNTDPFPVSDLIMDSTEGLSLDTIPETLLVVGGGYIGLELGTVYSALGSKVWVVDMADTVLGGGIVDKDLVAVLEKRLRSNFQDIWTNTTADLTVHSDHVLAKITPSSGQSFESSFDKILVAVGRKPNSQNLNLENTKVSLTDQKFIKTNEHCMTTDPYVFSIGDVVADGNQQKFGLAHVATTQGKVAIDVILGSNRIYNPLAVPAVVFTDPEVAWCGLTETQAQIKKQAIEVCSFPWIASGRATTLGDNEGLTKLIIDPETKIVLGMGIVGAGAGELIAEGALAVEMGCVAEDLQLTIHPHPTLSETVMETAELFSGHTTHL